MVSDGNIRSRLKLCGYAGLSRGSVGLESDIWKELGMTEQADLAHFDIVWTTT